MSNAAEKIEDTTEDREERNVRILEALLFASNAPVSTKELHARMPKDSDVGHALMVLKEQYQDRGVHLVEMEGTWAFRTANDLGDALAVEKDVEKKLSRAAMETLAIVAYHQPITRAEIENIRGVTTHKGTLDALMEMGWVKPGKRRETIGRPVTWVTTATFLDHFSLEAITDLPGLEDLKASGLLDKRPAIDTIPTGDLFERITEEEGNEEDEESEDEDEFDDDTYDESDDEDSDDDADEEI